MNFFKRVLSTLLIFILIFTLNIFEAKSFTLNNSDKKSSQIYKYIPTNNEILFYSNYKNNEINKFIKRKFTDKEVKKINKIKEGLISLLGLDLKDNLNDIYDDEFILSTFKISNKKRDILIILKVKNIVDFNKMLNTDNNNYKSNKIIKILKPNTLNLVTHFIETKDNYIIFASNKNLIYDSLKGLYNNKIKNAREIEFENYKSVINNKRLFLYTSKQFYDFLNIKQFNFEDINYITEFKFEDKQLTLNSNSLNNNDKSLIQNDSNLIEKNEIILLSNSIKIYKNLIHNSESNKLFKELSEEISNSIKEKILIKINSNNWLMGFKKPRNKFSINQLASLKDFHQDIFENENSIYTVFSKNNLDFSDQKITFKPEQPIFLYESDNFNFLSNNLKELLNALILESLFKAESSNLIIDDNLIITNFTNHIYKDFLAIFNSLNYITSEGFTISLESIETKNTQKIPEVTPSIKLKTHINFT